MVHDVLNMRLAHLSYYNWDSHTSQKDLLDPNFDDLFGTSGGLATLWSEMWGIDGARDNVTLLFNSDFGRQLMDNGASGTDHGSGSYSVLVGGAVGGGVYGEMFPAREAEPDPSDSEGRPPLITPGGEILGLTAFDHVFGAACDWVEPGAGWQVFADRATAPLEAGVDLAGLFL